MRKQVLLLQAFLLIELHLAFAGVHRKDEYTGSTVLAPPSPPEGNTTFVDGATWCVASAGASISDLQVALDWACGSGSADCGPVQNGGPCFEPNTLAAHASFAFNSYYQQNGNSDIACNFGGTARITTHNPSYGSCQYSVSGPTSASTPKISIHSSYLLWGMFGVWMLWFLPGTSLVP